ncbi:unnamed protein product, partial [Rotaria magnacalcarata]
PAGKNYQSQPIVKTAICFNKRKRDTLSQQLSSTIINQTIPKTTSSISIGESSSKKNEEYIRNND